MDTPALPDTLTAYETQVAALKLHDGLDSAGIAERLGRTPGGIRTALWSCKAKLAAAGIAWPERPRLPRPRVARFVPGMDAQAVRVF